MQPARPSRARCAFARMFREQFRQLLGHDAAEFFGIDDGHRPPVVARDVVADADGDQLDGERVSMSSITQRR